MNLIGINIPIAKSGIEIKKENRGKFTASAKAAGESVLEHAHKVVNDPNATTLQKKRAQFAINATKFKHELGAKIHKVSGHRSILDNGWISDKSAKRPPRYDGGGSVKRVDWDSLVTSDEYRKRYGWKINTDAMRQIEDSLIGRNAGYPQRIAVLSQVVPESGGNTKAHGNGAHGLIGWRGKRALGLPTDLPGQIHKLMVELFEKPANGDVWYHGGEGTGVNTGEEMLLLYLTSNNTLLATKAAMKGLVRPPKSAWQPRLDFVWTLKQHMK